MKKLYTLFFLNFVFVISYSQFNTGSIVLDGIANEIAYKNTISSQSGSYSLAWDDDYLYIQYSGGQANEPVIIYLKANPIMPIDGGSNNSGNLIGANFWGITPALPFRSDFQIYWESQYAEYRKSDGSGGWSNFTAFNSLDRSDLTSSEREIRIAWTSIMGLSARPEQFLFFAYANSRANPGYIYNVTPTENPNGSALANPVNSFYWTISSTNNNAFISIPFTQKSFANKTSSTISIEDLSLWDLTVNGNPLTIESNITINNNLYIDSISNSTISVLGNRIITFTGSNSSIINNSKSSNSINANPSFPDNTSTLSYTIKGNIMLSGISTSVNVYNLSIEEGAKFILNGKTLRTYRNAVIRVKSGGTIDCGTGTINKRSTSVGTQFFLEDNATIIIANSLGLNSKGAFGSINTDEKYFSSNANYVFNSSINILPNDAFIGDFMNQTQPVANQVKNLTINITNANNVFIDGNLRVTETLQLLNGHVNTQNFVLSIGANTQLIGGSANSYVSGFFQRDIATGTNDYFFPVGDERIDGTGIYAPVYTQFRDVTSAGSLKVSTLNFYHPRLARSQITFLKHVNRYWSLQSNLLSFSTARLNFNWASSDVESLARTSNFVVGKLDVSSLIWTYPTIINRTSSSITTDVSSFSEFTMGEPNTPLPATLLSIDVAETGSNNLITWKTASEINLDKFELERSTNGVDFVFIGQTTAYNTLFTKNYNYIDNNPLNGYNYYRLKIIDLDGTFTYSPIVRINRSSKAKANVQVYPNPVKNGSLLQLEFTNLPSGRYELNLFSINGAKLMSNIIQHNGANANRSILLPSNIKNGYYALSVSNESGFSQTIKFIVQ